MPFTWHENTPLLLGKCESIYLKKSPTWKQVELAANNGGRGKLIEE
jgi:hypothetical protein